MCTYNAIRIFPNRDIVVYKYLFAKKQGGDKMFWSPYYDFLFEVGKTYETNTEIATSTPNKNLVFPSVNGGFFHSYMYYTDAKHNAELAKYRLLACNPGTVIGKFIIPKDAIVLKGKDGNCLYRDTYCSTKLKFVGIVDKPDRPEPPSKPFFPTFI